MSGHTPWRCKKCGLLTLLFKADSSKTCQCPKIGNKVPRP